MNIQPLINAIRYKLRYGITVEWYNFWYMALRCHQKITPQVASIDETIRIIVEDQCSVSRFGDGEMLLTNPDKEIGFQKGNVLLAQRLKEVLTSHEEGHLVCISDTFENIYRYNRKARRFWRTHFFLYGRLVGPLAVARQAILQYIHHPSLHGLRFQRRLPTVVSPDESYLERQGCRIH